MLLEVAVVARQRLPAVDRIVAGVDVEHDFGGRRAPRTDKQIAQVVVEDLDPPGLGGTLFQKDGAFVRRQLRLAAGVGVLETRQRGRAGQGPLGVRRDVGQDLEQRVVAQGLGVVAVGIAGQELIDLLGEEGLGRVMNELGGAWVGESLGQVGDDPQGLLEGADGEQAGVGDDASPVEDDVDLLRAEIPEGKVRMPLGRHDLKPPHGSKLFGKYSLDSV